MFKYLKKVYNKELKNPNGWVYILIWANVYVFAYYLSFSLAMKVDNTNTVQTAILGVSATIVFHYTYETKKLRIESQKQTDFEMRPYLRLQVGLGDTEYLQVVNEGKGLALHVKLRFLFRDKDVKTIIRREVISLGSENVTDLSVEELEDELVGITQELKLVRTNWVDILKTNLNEDRHITVTYQDIEGRSFQAHFKYEPEINDGLVILDQEMIK